MGGGPEESSELIPGAMTYGKYQLFAKLGSGGMAEVYLAIAHGPMGFNKLVVLKRLRTQIAENAPMVTMFLDEARLTARLTHPNIVHTYEVGEHDGAFFIAMEYLEGQPLNKVVRAPSAREMISPVMWARVIADALRGLHHAHELQDYDGQPLGIVHRDISPHNIFLTYSGEVKVVDFGIAKAAVNSTQTEIGVLKGKISYMSPEQIRGEADRRSDIFGMGVTMWELLVGHKLFTGDSVKILQTILNEPIPTVRSVRPEIDPVLDAIVAKALDKEMDDRFQTAEEMREALEQYVRSTGEVVREATIGAAVTTMFQARKDKVHRQVHEHMQTASSRITTSEIPPFAGESHATLPEIGGTPSELSVKLFTRYEPTGSGTPPPPMPLSLPPHASPRQKKTRWLAAGAIALLLGGGAVVKALRAGASPATALVAPIPQTRSGTVEISLQSAPGEAAVDWNGRQIGHTPLQINVPPGYQTFVLSKAGFYAETIALEVPADNTRQLSRLVRMRAIELQAMASTPSALPVPVPVAPSRPTPPPSRPYPYHEPPRSVHVVSPVAAAHVPPASAANAANIKVRILDDEDPAKSINVIQE